MVYKKPIYALYKKFDLVDVVVECPGKVYDESRDPRAYTYDGYLVYIKNRKVVNEKQLTVKINKVFPPDEKLKSGHMYAEVPYKKGDKLRVKILGRGKTGGCVAQLLDFPTKRIAIIKNFKQMPKIGGEYCVEVIGEKKHIYVQIIENNLEDLV